jgi:hypothetical protein
MTTVNYPTPILVNGYACKNCTDVDYAKKHIDPQHPKDGPYGIDKDLHPRLDASDPTAASDAPKTADHGPAVLFGGRIAPPSPPTDPSATPAAAAGQRLDLTV